MRSMRWPHELRACIPCAPCAGPMSSVRDPMRSMRCPDEFHVISCACARPIRSMRPMRLS
eukprot:362239-Chlamydomonas_euryale.AAC.9